MMRLRRGGSVTAETLILIPITAVSIIACLAVVQYGLHWLAARAAAQAGARSAAVWLGEDSPNHEIEDRSQRAAAGQLALLLSAASVAEEPARVPEGSRLRETWIHRRETVRFEYRLEGVRSGHPTGAFPTRDDQFVLAEVTLTSIEDLLPSIIGLRENTSAEGLAVIPVGSLR